MTDTWLQKQSETTLPVDPAKWRASCLTLCSWMASMILSCWDCKRLEVENEPDNASELWEPVRPTARHSWVTKLRTGHQHMRTRIQSMFQWGSRWQFCLP